MCQHHKLIWRMHQATTSAVAFVLAFRDALPEIFCQLLSCLPQPTFFHKAKKQSA